MCNGDLGMYRVMPWAYPTIPGQSSGGTSVDPKPDPSVEPYDVSQMVISIKSRQAESRKLPGDKVGVEYMYTISGVSTIDDSNVSQIESIVEPNGEISVSPSTIGGDSNPVVGYANIYRVSVNGSSNAVDFIWNTTSGVGTVVTLSGNVKVTLKVYDVAGNLLQTITGVTTS